jgi:hypothetical protein
MRQLWSIALSVEGNQLPTEFRLFKAGWNETEKGAFMFDAAAAASVMAAYRAWGIDLAIDLEHQMLSPDAQPDPTARDARGWAKLELRPDGSLWAVNVRWTEDGAERLTQKRQRYVSPAFEIDPKTKRVTKIINVAITALPATHHTPALIAADARGCMDPNLVKEALDALVAGDAEKCMEILKGAIAAAASAEAPAEEPSAEAPPAEMSEKPAPDQQPADGQPAPSADDEEKKAQAAASARLVRLTAKSSLGDALAEVEIWKASYVERETERARIAEEKKVLESAERRRLCVDLVKMGAEFPSTVWVDEKAQAPKSRWSSMPIEQLREHVAEQRAARRIKTELRAPAGDATESGSKTFTTPQGVVTLTASELGECERAGAKPEVYAENKARRSARRGG